MSACFGSTYTKIGMIQRRLAWPLCRDDTQIREAFHIFYKRVRFLFDLTNIFLVINCNRHGVMLTQ